jgi:hypothetical protein
MVVPRGGPENHGRVSASRRMVESSFIPSCSYVATRMPGAFGSLPAAAAAIVSR